MPGDVNSLLERVRRFAMPEGPVACRSFHLQQVGEIRLAPGKPWIAFRAEQRFDAAGLDFRWTARARMARVLPVKVIDAFEGGHGHLSVRIAGILPVARAQGLVVDRGEVMRAIAESPWRPTGFSAGSALQLAWSEAAGGVLRASFDGGATCCCVDFEVDADGRILTGSAPDRPRGLGKTFVLTPWRGLFFDYRYFGRFRVPAPRWPGFCRKVPSPTFAAASQASAL
jgi:hypothetical protein